MAWRFVLCNLAGTPVGEPRAYDRTLTVGRSRVATASFRVRPEDPTYELTGSGEAMLKVYDSVQNLCFYGPVIADQENASGQGPNVQVTAADVAWRLGKRYVVQNVSGIGTEFTGDSGTLAYTFLGLTNANAPTGISQGNKDTFVSRSVTYLWKRVLDALNELGSIAGSYEWQLRYIDGNPPTVYLDLLSMLGDDREADVFLEYGCGSRNCSTYTRARTADLLATYVYVLGGSSTALAVGYDTAAVQTYGLYEDVLTFSDITVTGLLDALAAAHVAARRRPRSMINLTPFPKTAPRFGADWTVGDRVTARVMVNGKVRANGIARIWGAEIRIDELGNETATLELVPS